MKVKLPPLPDRALRADLCREAAARELVQPELIEKDFFLTRLLWALGGALEDRLLLKGGTLLTKVDLGFFRMSEDADLVVPEAPSRNRGSNVRLLNKVRDALREVSGAVGITLPFPGGVVYDKGGHMAWEARYDSDFGPQSIRVEASLREVLRPPRSVTLKQLLSDPLIGDHSGASCWALAAEEARAEKVRAACTREAIRDFYDLDRLAGARVDLSSDAFLELVNAKLGELGAPPLRSHGVPFGLNEQRLRSLREGLRNELAAVLRQDAPSFDLDTMVDRFRNFWRPAPSAK